MKQIILLTIFISLIFSSLKKTFGQANPCKYLISGKLVDKYKTKISTQEIIIRYKLHADTNEFDTKIIESDNDGLFDFCLDINKPPSQLEIEIVRKGFRTYSKHLILPNSEELKFKTIFLREKEQIETPTPTDFFDNTKLNSVGQTSIGKVLSNISPSFNSSTQPISDGSAHFDPTDFRNLGSSRILFLVNGIRKNMSANIQVNDVPNKGEVGIDIRSIPLAAIEQVSIEKQEKTTLYGSDAIAGTIDFKLKRNTDELKFSPFLGVNKDNWDGTTYGFDFNKGFAFSNSGFINFTFSNITQKESNRQNNMNSGYDSLYVESKNPVWNQWLNNHKDLGMKIGSPNMTTNSVFYNTELMFLKGYDNKFYSFGGITYRNTQSYAIYRAPYWIKDNFNIFSSSVDNYEGFQPTFESDVTDNFFVMGINGRVTESETSQLEYDLSQTISSNDIDYTVNHSFNPSLGINSPTSFKVGGYTLGMNSTRLNLNWSIKDFELNFGSEFRNEMYVIKAGEESSYTGEGSISYSGTQPQNSLTTSRNNFGSFFQIRYNNSKLNIDGSARYEKYTNFPENIALQISGLYKIINEDDWRLLIRSSISTGYRAPSLQQLYYNRVQTLVSGNTISNRGTFNSFSPVVRQLGIPELKNEASQNFSFGSSFNVSLNEESGINLSADFYNIEIKNRIVLSGNIDTLTDNSNKILTQILKQNNISSLNIFLNGIDTKTSGVDLGLRYYTIFGNYNFELSGNSNYILTNGLTPINISTVLSKANFFDRKEQSRLLYSRPSSKSFINLKIENKDVWSFLINYTNYGSVKWFHPTDPSKDQVFKSKGIFNLFLDFSLSSKVSLSLNINNLFNTYPDVLNSMGDSKTNVGGRFKYYREVNQFDYNGTSFLLKLLLKL